MGNDQEIMFTESDALKIDFIFTVFYNFEF